VAPERAKGVPKIGVYMTGRLFRNKLFTCRRSKYVRDGVTRRYEIIIIRTKKVKTTSIDFVFFVVRTLPTLIEDYIHIIIIHIIL